MANWIKWSKGFLDKPEVGIVSDVLGINRYHAGSLLMKFFEWADSNTQSGRLPGVTERFIDEIIGHQNFAEALKTARWLRKKSGTLVMPHFDRHNGESAKKRLIDAERQRSYRENSSKSDNGEVSHSKRDKNRTREEERRGEETEENPSPSDSEVSCSEDALPDSGSASGGHGGVRNTTLGRIAEAMKIRPYQADDDSAPAKQSRSDLTCLRRIVDFNITAIDIEQARQQARELHNLVREATSSCGRSRPIVKLMYLAKQRGMYPMAVKA